MKHTTQDFVFGRQLPCSHDPAHVPFTFTLDGTRYCGFPASLSPRTECVRIDASITCHRFTAHAGGLRLTAERYDYRDFAVCEWIMYAENVSDTPSATLSNWRFCAEIAAQKADLYHGNGYTCGTNGYEFAHSPVKNRFGFFSSVNPFKRSSKRSVSSDFEVKPCLAPSDLKTDL